MDEPDPGTRSARPVQVSEWRRYTVTVYGGGSTFVYELSEDEYKQVEVAVGAAVRAALAEHQPSQVSMGAP